MKPILLISKGDMMDEVRIECVFLYI